MRRASSIDLLASAVGFTFGAAALGFAALFLGMWLLRFAPGGIHSDWALAVRMGTLVCIGRGGAAGAVGAVRLARSWRD